MELEKIIELFLEEKISAREVSDMLDNDKMILERIKDKFEYGKIIQKLNKKYREVMNQPVILPHQCTWKDTIIALMIAIENKKNVEDVANGFYHYDDNYMY